MHSFYYRREAKWEDLRYQQEYDMIDIPETVKGSTEKNGSKACEKCRFLLWR